MSNKMTKQEASKAIAELVEQAYAFIASAEKIAEESGVSFSFNVAYGMGGTYIPENHEYARDYDEPGWKSSSHSC